MDAFYQLFTMGRLVKLAICIAGGIALGMYVQVPVYMIVGFAVFLLVGFDILKDKNLPVGIRFAACALMIILFAYLIRAEYGMGDEFKYFTSFTGGCMVWFLGFDLFKRLRGSRQGS